MDINKRRPAKRTDGKERIKQVAGKTPTPIDWKSVQLMCSMLATYREIASKMGVAVATIERRCKKECKMSFSEFYEKHSADGKLSIRRAQFQLMQDGNATMAIYLGKVVLGQREATAVVQDDALTPDKLLEMVKKGKVAKKDRSFDEAYTEYTKQNPALNDKGYGI